MSWGAQNRSKDAKIPNIGPTMSEEPIFYQLFNKSTPPPSDLKLAHWKLGINLLSERRPGHQVKSRGLGPVAHPVGWCCLY
jgi:hypothetical protein